MSKTLYVDLNTWRGLPLTIIFIINKSADYYYHHHQGLRTHFFLSCKHLGSGLTVALLCMYNGVLRAKITSLIVFLIFKADYIVLLIITQTL